MFTLTAHFIRDVAVLKGWSRTDVNSVVMQLLQKKTKKKTPSINPVSCSSMYQWYHLYTCINSPSGSAVLGLPAQSGMPVAHLPLALHPDMLCNAVMPLAVRIGVLNKVASECITVLFIFMSSSVVS